MELYLFAVFLGLVQGLTEFLPVSSSGHLAFLENIPAFSGMASQIDQNYSLLTFNIFLHGGTLLAVILFWRKDLLKIIMGFFQEFKEKNWQGQAMQMVVLLFWACLPLVIVPLIKHLVEAVTHSLIAVGWLFIINGLILIIAERIYKRKANNHIKIEEAEDLKWYQSLIIGFFQLLAILPGISRSGSTISAGQVLRLEVSQSVRFSFLISIPALLAATLLDVKDMISTPAKQQDWLLIFFAVLTSFVSGLMSLRFLVWLGKKALFSPFGFYTMILGTVILVFIVK